MAGLARDLRSLALLLDQGQPLSQTLRRLSTQNAIWIQAAEQAEAGSSWTELKASLPSVLARLAPGEVDLPENLRLCARFLEDLERRRRFWRQISLYPIMLCVAALLLGLFVSLLYRSEIQMFGASGSLATRMMSWFANTYLLCFPLLMWLPLVLGGLLRLPKLRMYLPVLGYAARLHESASFLRWLELAMRQQPGLPEAIEAASQACVIEPMSRGLASLAESLRQGSRLSGRLDQQRWLPAQFRWALAQAEAGGFRSPHLLALSDLIEQKLHFYRVFMAGALALAAYLAAAGMVLWCSLCVLLPLLGSANLL